jgi:hypothetical protein
MSAKRTRKASDTRKPSINESGRPETGGGEGRQDVTGRIPDDIRIDPDLTEGHPGYQESGDSELINPEQFGNEGTK